MVSELCLRYICKECPEQIKCFGCEHNYILVKTETMTNLYKCSKCGDKLRLNKDNTCCKCIWSCKGQVENKFIDNKGTFNKCNRFHKEAEEIEEI